MGFELSGRCSVIVVPTPTALSTGAFRRIAARPVDLRQAETSAASDLLGGQKRLEILSIWSGGTPPHSLPLPHRGALVLNRDGYDFTVAGPISDLAQCLEQTQAVDQSVYSECRKL